MTTTCDGDRGSMATLGSQWVTGFDPPPGGSVAISRTARTLTEAPIDATTARARTWTVTIPTDRCRLAVNPGMPTPARGGCRDRQCAPWHPPPPRRQSERFHAYRRVVMFDVTV